jgi:predicted nucleic acid-binding Zn ribbon protein
MTRSKPTLPAAELTTLPFQVRPVAGEGRESFIERLAEANFLKTDYLRRVLREPPWHRGEPQWERLAAATGRDVAELRDILGHGRCKESGSPISTESSNQRRTCSAACRTKSYRRRLPEKPEPRRSISCAHCDRSLSVGASELRRYCSHACREAAYRKRRREREAIPLANCEACQKPIGRVINRRYCSERCSDWAWRKRQGHTTALAPDSPYPGQPKTCTGCGDPLEPGSRRVRLTCSPRCEARAYRRRRAAQLAADSPPL